MTLEEMIDTFFEAAKQYQSAMLIGTNSKAKLNYILTGIVADGDGRARNLIIPSGRNDTELRDKIVAAVQKDQITVLGIALDDTRVAAFTVWSKEAENDRAANAIKMILDETDRIMKQRNYKISGTTVEFKDKPF